MGFTRLVDALSTKVVKWSSGWELEVGEGWLSMAGLQLRSHRVLLQDGIERLRTFLRNPGNGAPRITVNSRCQALIRELPLPRAAGASSDFGGADPLGQSCDQGAVLSAILSQETSRVAH